LLLGSTAAHVRSSAHEPDSEHVSHAPDVAVLQSESSAPQPQSHSASPYQDGLQVHSAGAPRQVELSLGSISAQLVAQEPSALHTVQTAAVALAQSMSAAPQPQSQRLSP
jgi:hypothetical protein